MLRSEGYRLHSFGTGAALLRDPRSHAHDCIIIDVSMRDAGGMAFLKAMRAVGWQGRAILLDGEDLDGRLAAEAAQNGDRIYATSITDRALTIAVAASFA